MLMNLKDSYKAIFSFGYLFSPFKLIDFVENFPWWVPPMATFTYAMFVYIYILEILAAAFF